MTGDKAQVYSVYMCWWDREIKRKLYEHSIILLVFIRYEDEINYAIDKLKQITENTNEEERN